MLDACVTDVFYVSFADEMTVKEQHKEKRHLDHLQQSKSHRQRMVGSKRQQQQRQQKLAGKGMQHVYKDYAYMLCCKGITVYPICFW